MGEMRRCKGYFKNRSYCKKIEQESCSISTMPHKHNDSELFVVCVSEDHIQLFLQKYFSPIAKIKNGNEGFLPYSNENAYYVLPNSPLTAIYDSLIHLKIYAVILSSEFKLFFI